MIEKSNFKVNSKIKLGEGVINGQGCGEVAKMRYGLFPMSYNGCEMIAIYNLMLLEGYKGHKLDEICLEMYPKSGVAWGIFGSDCYKLRKYFEVRGIEYMRFLKRDSFFEQLEISGLGIITFWNHKNPFKGIHTVCVQRIPDGYRIYNRYNNKDYPYEYKKVSEVVDRSRFLCGYCLKK